MFQWLIVLAVSAVASTGPLTAEQSQDLPRFPSARIIEGRNGDIKEVPYQVSIQVGGRHGCGGSIISKNWIVTAAHCVSSSRTSKTHQYIIHAGSTYRSKGGSQHSVDSIIAHDKFGVGGQGMPSNDIALMHVSEPFHFDETRQPITLFDNLEEAPDGALAVVSGWGLTDRHGLSFSEILQILEVPVVSKKKCNQAYESFGGIPDKQICAGYPEGGKGFYTGDSGGGLAVEKRLAGIVSWAPTSRTKYPDVYEEVAAHREWIRFHTGV